MPINRKYRPLLALSALAFTLSASAIFAQDAAEAAEIVNDEGGVQQIIGTVPNSDSASRDFYTRPIVILEDQAGFIDRDFEFFFPPESQVIGDFTDNFYDLEDLSIDYALSLPTIPLGSARDVDQDDEEDAGVQVFATALWDNIYGDLTIERYDLYGYGGWSGADASTIASENPETAAEYTGGRIIVWSPDDEQGFPSGFGDDGLLFTEDDPIVTLPSGWTMVDMDSETFTFDRSNVVTMDTHEVEAVVPDDFSELSYTEAFAEVLTIGREEYAYTDLKDIDWDALEAEFMPRIQAAEDAEDADAYLLAMYEFAISIPDGHVGFYSLSSTVIEDTEQALIDGGLGIALRELTDGRLIVVYVLADSPAAEAGIVYGAEVTALDGQPIDEAIDAVDSVNAPYSLPEIERLDQVRFVTRFPLDTEVEVTYLNPGDDEETTVSLTVIAERDSLRFTRQFIYGQAVATAQQPVSWEFLPSGYGYLNITTFSGEGEVIMDTILDFIRTATATGAPGIIIDLRTNSGGYGGFYLRTAGFFFNEEVVYGYDEAYNRDIEDFYYDERFPTIILPYPDPANIWDGPVALLVNPACASACEGFADLMTQNDRSAVVGQYPTNGIIGGRYFDIALPEESFLSLPTIRQIDLEGNNLIEGEGVQPTVLVPITEENATTTIAEADIVLDAAIAYLDESLAAEIIDGGEIVVGEGVSGTLTENVRFQYTLTVEENGIYDILTGDPAETGELDTVLRIYQDDELVTENDDLVPGSVFTSGFEGVELAAGDVLVLEVAGYDDVIEGDFTLTVTVAETEE